MKFPDKTYNIIYADPPWSYRDKRGGVNSPSGGVLRHYTTMTNADIMALRVADITSPDSILFLWATFPNLPAALDVIEAWGFKYKSLGFSWIKTYPKSGKPVFGIGYYTKSNCEVCLIATRGRVKVLDNTISSVIFAERGRHSAKPMIIRDKIVQLCGDLPRIELFARQTVPGWDSWGNEVNEQP